MSIYEKLRAIQVAIKAPKNLYNSFGKYLYRNAEGICEAVKPFLSEHRCALTLSDTIETKGDRIYVMATAVITDIEDGSTVTVSAFAREPEEKKGMDESQITGTASSYARKYALNGLFLLDDTKDADTDEYHNVTNPSRSAKKPISCPKSPKADNSTTDEPKVVKLTKLCAQDGIDSEWLAKKYGVPDLMDMPDKYLTHALNKWESIKEAFKEDKK